MLTVSDAFKTQLENDNRKYLHKIDFTLADGTTLQVTNDDLWSGSPKFSKATSGNGNFDVGAFIIGNFNFILNDMYGRFGDTYDFNLATVDYQIGLALPNGNTEYVRIGRYVVDEVDYDGYLISIECLDYAYYFEQPWATTLNFPTTAGAIIQEACTRCGITLATSSWDGYNIPVNAKPQDKNLTWLSAIGYAAQICGQYAKMDNLGRLVIGWYDIDNLSQVTVDGAILDSTDSKILDHVDNPILGSMTGETDNAWNALPTLKKSKYARLNHISKVKVGHYPILITGVKCTVRNGDNDVEYVTGTNEYVIDVTGNPFIGNGNVNAVITRIAENTVGHYFYTFDASYLSRPYYEAGDLAWVEDYRNGRVYCSFITNMTFSSGQYQESSCGAETPAKKQTATYTPAMKILAEAGRNVRESLDSYESIAKQMTELISLGYGMYFSGEPQGDGSTIYYLHDKATIEQSSNVWKVTSAGLVVSHDGGTTWAIDENGNALYNVLTARGINADWINSGKISIKDGNGNTTFEADTATGNVVINATSFTLTGRTINNIVQDTVNGMDLNNVVMELDNDYQLIPTDSDGNYTTFPQCSSTAKVFYGATDITSSAAFGTPSVQNVSGTWNATTKTYTVTGLTSDSGTVTFTAIYGSVTLSKQFTVVKSKQGEDGDSVSITSTSVTYKASTSATTIPTGTWSDTIVSANGKYLWTRTIVSYSDGTSTTSYSVSRQGIDGTNGTNGTNGRDGTNGTSNFVHIKYSPVANPSDSDITETPDEYIGICVDMNVADPTTASSYTWTKFKGDDGEQGIPGTNGTNGTNGMNGRDGVSSYVHFAYSTSSDGHDNFSTTNFSGATYLGVLTDSNVADSTNYADYTWSLIKGADGTSVTIASTEVRYQASDSNTTVPSGTWSNTPVSANGRYLWTRTIVNYSDGHSTTSYTISRQGIDGTNGTNGVNGADGRDGTSNYIHIKYSPVANPADIDITESPDEYIGVCVDNNIADPTTASSYTWTKFRGSDGAQGIPGTNGTNGQDGVSSYVHFAYSTSADGSQNFSTIQFAGATYLGVLTDSTLADSTVYSDYAWSLIKGADGRDGADGTSVTILGSYDTLSQLQAAHPTGSAGDAYIINGDLYVWASNAWTNVGQIQGPAGRDGTDGTDGASAYVHFAYSTSSNGQQNFSVTPFDGATYIGVRSDTTQADSTVYSDYTWSLMKGADGTSVTITSTEVRYKAGTSATTAPTGTWSSTIPSVAGGSYLWTRTIVNYSDGTRTTSYSVARQGINGTNGTNGINGTDGRDGTSNYVHIKYSAVANPSDAQMTENPSDYIGICVDTNAADPSTASSYTWSRWTGEDGSNGINGTNGTDGTSAYVHFAYASSADGQTGFSTSYFSEAAYIGVRSDTTQADSTNYQDYTWSKMKGDDGTSVTITSTSVRYQSGTSATTAPTGTWQSSIPSVAGGNYLWTRTIVNYSDGTSTTSYSVARQGINGTNGTNGINGTNGTNGTSSYVHIKYSAVANPTSDQMTETPSDYIGLCIDNNEEDPTSSGAYTWTRWSGVDGTNGINGTNGTDGTPAYVHFAYAKSADGSQNFSNVYFDGAVYIGVRSDASVADSTNYRDYTWSKMRGDDGRGVVSITEYYGISNSTSTQPSSWSTSVVNPTASNRYLWNYNTTSYTSGSPSSTDPRIIGMYSADGASGRGISSITEYYQVSSSSTTAPTSWSTSMVNTTTTNKYLWNYEKITYTDGSESSSTPRIIGTHGATGTSARTYLLEVSPKSTKMTQANVYSPNQITIKSYYRDGTSTNKTAYSATYRVDVCVGNTWYENICSLTSRTSAILELRYDAQASTPYDYYDSGAAPDPTDTFDICAVLSPGSTSVRVRMLNGSTLLDQEEIALLSDATAVVLDQESVFNALTNNGQDQGIFLNASDHKIYINSSYIATGTLKVGGANNSNGTIRVLDANNKLIGGINNTEIYHKNTSNDKISMNSGGLYFYKNTSTEIGSIGRGTYNGNDSLEIYGNALISLTSKGEIALWCQSGDHIYPGVRVIKDDNFPLRVEGKAAYEWSVKIPTAIDSNGRVTQYANLRIIDGIVYTE